MSRPRKRYRPYAGPRDLSSSAPSSSRPSLPKLLGIIRKTIKTWLDSTPAFTAEYFSTYLIVHDVSYGTQLAVIEFKEDHLVINVPQKDDSLAMLNVSMGRSLGGHEILYSDPGLHTRVKFVVNQAYQQQGR